MNSAYGQVESLKGKHCPITLREQFHTVHMPVPPVTTVSSFSLYDSLFFVIEISKVHSRQTELVGTQRKPENCFNYKNFSLF